MKRTIKQTCAAIVAAINAHNYDLAKQLATQVEAYSDTLPDEPLTERPPRTLPFVTHRRHHWHGEVRS